tara:strand:+ start:1173 stop:1781 length:609 start_codon:yes stop_codon:yes gene_type:complete
MSLKNLMRLFCINRVVAFTPPTPILPATNTFNDFMNVAFPLIVPAHGSIDVLHSIQENKTRNYLGGAVFTYTAYPLIHHFSEEASLGLFLIISAYHFRHQFSFISKEFNFFLSGLFIAYGITKPEFLYFFLTFIHTPAQYWKFRDNLVNDKMLSTILITSFTIMGMCISYSDWNDNILIMPALIAHMLYQEFLRFKLSNSII